MRDGIVNTCLGWLHVQLYAPPIYSHLFVLKNLSKTLIRPVLIVWIFFLESASRLTPHLLKSRTGEFDLESISFLDLSGMGRYAVELTFQIFKNVTSFRTGAILHE